MNLARLKTAPWDHPVWDRLDAIADEIYEDEDFVAKIEKDFPGIDWEGDEAEEIVTAEAWRRLGEEIQIAEDVRCPEGSYESGDSICWRNWR